MVRGLPGLTTSPLLLRAYEGGSLLVSNSYALACMFHAMPCVGPVLERLMHPLSLLVSILASRIRQLAEAFRPIWEVRKYCPERHYMRGPGPKWREKHSSHPA